MLIGKPVVTKWLLIFLLGTVGTLLTLEGCDNTEPAIGVGAVSPANAIVSQAALTATPVLTTSLTNPVTPTGSPDITYGTFITPIPKVETPEINNNLTGWQGEWLKGIPCRLPCWEGITLGVTTPDEAIAILKKTGFATDIKMVNTRIKNAPSIIEWKAMGNNNKTYSGEAYYYADDSHPVITGINTTLANYKLKDIIAIYRQPDYVQTVYMQRCWRFKY